MQNAKDTFYLSLRNRLTTVNPARTISIGGTLRPGILVEENETSVSQAPPDVFVLRWSGTAVQTQMSSALQAQTCDICYWTRGSDTNADMDRGRLLTTMDAELCAILQPAYAPKVSVANGKDLEMNTSIFWIDPVFAAVKRDDERISRTATVQVFSMQETLADGEEER